MKPVLERVLNTELYHLVNDQKVPGLPPNVRGDISPELRGNISPELWGEISGLRGKISPELWGNISPELRGNVSGLRGICTGLRGNLDDCEISDTERCAGIDIGSLVKSE